MDEERMNHEITVTININQCIHPATITPPTTRKVMHEDGMVT